MTKEQIAECVCCNHISGKKIWCCKYGFYIHEPERKVKTKNVVITKGKPQQYPSIITQAGSFGKAAVKQARAGNPKRSKEEIARIISICEACTHYNKEKKRCYVCGCYMKNKIPWQTSYCKKGKW